MSDDSRQLTYDIEPEHPAPMKGQYLVSIGKKGVGSIYYIMAVRLVKQKVVSELCRYSLTVVAKPELKPLTDYIPRYYGADVWVRGEPALPCFWRPRVSKQ